MLICRTMSGRRLREAVKQVRNSWNTHVSCFTPAARHVIIFCVRVRSSSRRGCSGTRRWWSLAWVTCTLTTSPPTKSTRYRSAAARRPHWRHGVNTQSDHCRSLSPFPGAAVWRCLHHLRPAHAQCLPAKVQRPGQSHRTGATFQEKKNIMTVMNK